MARCIKHTENKNNVTVPQDECDICIKNAFDPKKCRICRENDGYQIADGLIVCSNCEEVYW